MYEIYSAASLLNGQRMAHNWWMRDVGQRPANSDVFELQRWHHQRDQRDAAEPGQRTERGESTWLIDSAAYPTELIAHNSHSYRPLGRGLANLSAMLMSMDVPHDSDRGRAVAGSIKAVMCGQAS